MSSANIDTVCPVCGGNIVYLRKDKALIHIVFSSGGKQQILDNTDEGTVVIECSNDKTHHIGAVIEAMIESQIE